MFRALRVARPADAPAGIFRVDLVEDFDDDSLGEGNVVVDVQYSSLNFKDGMALRGDPGVARLNPLIPGIDLVGSVAASDDPRWKVGDQVLVNGWGLGETHNGGFSERARVSGDWLVALPDGITARRAAAIGTAGFTAMLSVLALERADALAAAEAGTVLGGEVLVTGSAGGVGSIAIAILAKLGHRVVASTGRLEETDYLVSLGASEVIDRTPLGQPGKPLQRERWSGAIDSVGGNTLANVLAQVKYGGAVTTCGMAQSPDVPASVLPFILRGISLVGINSVYISPELRSSAWKRLSTDLDLDLLDGMTSTVSLGETPALAEKILAGQVRGRIVVDVRA
ncbi:MAG: acuI [Microbacteriaceae bacterium]|nr:acuI [Microbacteriaceae bacterium]